MSMPNHPGRPLVVVSVGTDHHRFDRLVGWMDTWAMEHPEVEVIIQRGVVDPTEHAASQPLIPHSALCELFAAATAVVVHGGPSTVMDVRSAGRLPLVVARNPDLGEHVDGHQLRFAGHLRRHNLARIIDSETTLRAELTKAMTSPSAYSVAAKGGAIEGLAGFASVVEELLATTSSVARPDSVPTTIDPQRLRSGAPRPEFRPSAKTSPKLAATPNDPITKGPQMETESA